MAGLEEKVKSLFDLNIGSPITPNQHLILNQLLIQIDQTINREPVSPLSQDVLQYARDKRAGVTTLIALTTVALWDMYPSVHITLSTSSHGASVIMSKLIQRWMSSEFKLDEFMNLHAPNKQIAFKIGITDWFPIICSLGEN